MAKRRGRPRLKEKDRKSEPVGVRLTKELRDRLEEARRHGVERKLTEEIVLRLRESFERDKNIENRFGGWGTARLLEILADRIRSIETTTELRWFNDRFTYDHVRSMVDVVLDHFKPDGRRTIPKAMRGGYLPLLKNEVQNLGRHEALIALTFLQSAKRNDVPVLYDKAALPTGRRGEGSAADELLKLQKQRQQAILTTFELLARKVRPNFSFRRDVSPDRIIEGLVKAGERYDAEHGAFFFAQEDTEERLRRSQKKGKRK